MKSSLPCLSLAVWGAIVIAAPAQTGSTQGTITSARVAGNVSSEAVRRGHGATAGGNSGNRAASRDGLAPGDRLLVQAIHQLDRRASVTARLRYQAAIGEQPLSGTGGYWQQTNGDDLRVRMELQLIGQEAKLLQVSNSRFLWIDQQLPAGRSVTRVDLRQLRADPLFAAANGGQPIQPGEASWSPLQPELSAHSGGLPNLLASLSESFSFLAPQAMRLALGAPSGTETTTTPVFAVVGHWRPEQLSALTAASAASAVDDTTKGSQTADTAAATAPWSASLRARMPQEVLLLVGQADLFPYRVEYRHLETPAATNQNGAVIPFQISTNPMVVLELTDVAFDVPIAAGQFDYSPGDVDWVDQTAQLLERLQR